MLFGFAYVLSIFSEQHLCSSVRCPPNFFWEECWDLNQGLLGEKHRCYLCAMKPPSQPQKFVICLLRSYSAHLILSVSFNVVVHQMARIEIFSQPPYAAAPGFEPTSRVVLTRDLLKDALLTELLHPALEIKKCNLHNFSRWTASGASSRSAGDDESRSSGGIPTTRRKSDSTSEVISSDNHFCFS